MNVVGVARLCALGGEGGREATALFFFFFAL